MSNYNFCKDNPDAASRIITDLRYENAQLRAAGDDLADYVRGCDTPDAHVSVERWERLNNDDDE